VTIKAIYAHGMLVRCVCDWWGEFNAPLHAHVCAWSGVFVVHALGWTNDWVQKFGDDVGMLQWKTVFYLSSDITCDIFSGCC